MTLQEREFSVGFTWLSSVELPGISPGNGKMAMAPHPLTSFFLVVKDGGFPSLPSHVWSPKPSDTHSIALACGETMTSRALVTLRTLRCLVAGKSLHERDPPSSIGKPGVQRPQKRRFFEFVESSCVCVAPHLGLGMGDDLRLPLCTRHQYGPTRPTVHLCPSSATNWSMPQTSSNLSISWDTAGLQNGQLRAGFKLWMGTVAKKRANCNSETWLYWSAQSRTCATFDVGKDGRMWGNHFPTSFANSWGGVKPCHICTSFIHENSDDDFFSDDNFGKNPKCSLKN